MFVEMHQRLRAEEWWHGFLMALAFILIGSVSIWSAGVLCSSLRGNILQDIPNDALGHVGTDAALVLGIPVRSSGSGGLTMLKPRYPEDFRKCAKVFGEQQQLGLIPVRGETAEDMRLLVPYFLFVQGEMDWAAIRKFINHVNQMGYGSSELKGFWRSMRGAYLKDGEAVRLWFQVLGDYMNTYPNEHGYW